jgi:hypothetical protein
MRSPAATSQQAIFLTQKASSRPQASQARLSAVETSATGGMHVRHDGEEVGDRHRFGAHMRRKAECDERV